uniref:Venom pacifastin domain containing protein 2 n=1 Tax=Lethocerus distinctifemur TaxID=280095 RepID=A0A2K8JRF0_9HEMI|nr:venom pacifastin domain containing protein 2 [Lethocerus distinctifemur]
MNSYGPLLLLMAASFCFAAHNPPPVGCSPGSRKVEGFRSCTCSRLAVWECSNKPIGHQHHKRYAAQNPPLLGCRPGSRKVEGSRSCTCSRLAVWECSNKPIGHQHHKRYAAQNPPLLGCRPGSRKVEGSRSCTCSRLAVWECNNIGQSHHHGKRATNSQRKCTPGTTWHEDCNTCGCDNNGNVYCTAMLCMPGMNPIAKRAAQEDEDRCNPGDRWTDECNQCKCSDKGYPLCTRMSCHPLVVALKPKRSISLSPGGKKCTPGQTWTDECGNRCSCRPNGAAVCTEMGCLRTKRSPQGDRTSCTPGEKFMVDCSPCWCGPDGKSSGCTYKPCPPGHKPKTS